MYHSVGINNINDRISELLKITNHHAQVKNKDRQKEHTRPKILTPEGSDCLVTVIISR